MKQPGRRTTMARTGEGLVAGALGAGLAWAVLSPFGTWTPGLVAAGAVVGGLNGLVSGVAGIYEWRLVRGWLCFVLDSTWALPGVAAGVLLHAANVLHPNPSYVAGMSRRVNRHVYEGGYSARPGFALALGNVVSGAGGSVGLRGDSERVVRRRKLVEVHESAHLFQNRLLGPLYTLGYLAWMAAAGGVGLFVSLARDRKHLWSVIETFAYYDNPFEYWAYRKDDYWPPVGAHPRYVWGSRRLRRRDR